MAKILTPKQQRACLVGLGWPLDRPGNDTAERIVEAVRDFQIIVGGIKVDGIWGPQTQLAAFFCGVDGGRAAPHFTTREFACRCWERGYHGRGFCHGWIKASRKLVVSLEALRARCGGPVPILNGYRCPLYNVRAGGAARSQHLRGTAVDVPLLSLTVAQVRALGLFSGIGYRKSSRVVRHVDVRAGVSPSSPSLWQYDT